MPISREEFIKRYPVLYHVSLATSIDSIRQHGLRSTSALLDLFDISGLRRDELESCRRTTSVGLVHPEHGTVYLNDQSPLQKGPLQRCLEGLSIVEWIRELNRRVFFFPNMQRVKRFHNAKLARGRQRVTVAVETDELFKLGGDRIQLCSINSGCTTRRSPKRGTTTFQTLHEFPYQERRKQYGPAGAFAEVTFPFAVPPAIHFELVTM